jgi:non-ribosomal peptide synthase protein (TIGR01720 family)
VQRWFLDSEPVDPQHFAHALAFDLARRVDAPALGRALAAVVARHDALRTGYVCGRDGWRTLALAPDDAFTVAEHDVSASADADAEVERISGAAQAALGLERGPIVRALLIERGMEQPQRLVVIAHHLAVDVFSWGVLLGDLEAALAASLDGRPVELEPATTPYADWAARLAEHAASPAMRAEASRWLALEAEDVRPLPRDSAAGRNTEADAAFVDVSLDEEDTRRVVDDAPRAFGAQASDVLLAALERTLTGWAGGPVLIDLEGHGREDVGGADLSRTVGWFTAIHPFALRPGGTVADVRDRLRAIPAGGIGFGILRHLSPDAATRRRLPALPWAEAVFLHLGRNAPGQGGGLLSPADAPLGPSRSPRAHRTHLVEVTTAVDGGRLTARFRYSAAVHDASTISTLAAAFLGHARALADTRTTAQAAR